MRPTSIRRLVLLAFLLLAVFSFLFLSYNRENWPLLRSNKDLLIIPRIPTDVYLIIIVLSSVENILGRQTIRQTWASNARKYNVSVLFVVGFSDDYDNSDLSEEAQLYHDLLQVKVKEHHRHLLQKVSLAYNLLNRAASAEFLLKTDDDCFVNIPLLVARTRNSIDKSRILVGHAIDKATVVSDPHYKYYFTSPTQGALFPEYLSGTGYLMSWDVLDRFVNCPLPTIPIEDVYFTGLCRQFYGLGARHSDKFGFEHRPSVVCLLRSLIIMHGMQPEDMKNTWGKFTSQIVVCGEQPTDDFID